MLAIYHYQFVSTTICYFSTTKYSCPPYSPTASLALTHRPLLNGMPAYRLLDYFRLCKPVTCFINKTLSSQLKTLTYRWLQFLWYKTRVFQYENSCFPWKKLLFCAYETLVFLRRNYSQRKLLLALSLCPSIATLPSVKYRLLIYSHMSEKTDGSMFFQNNTFSHPK